MATSNYIDESFNEPLPNVIGKVLVSSRPLDEYCAMFGLTCTDIGKAILDCPGGAASFAAELNAVGGNVTACDPVYGTFTPEELERHSLSETERGNRYVREHPSEYVWTFFADADDHLQRRKKAGIVFARDFAAHPRRYVRGFLPRLPFEDRQFDLVLSSHLLFSYADRLDFTFHVEGIRELLRIAKDEVRIFPLVSMGIYSYNRLGQLLDTLEHSGIGTSVSTVEYEFQRGANQLLTCRRLSASE